MRRCDPNRLSGASEARRQDTVMVTSILVPCPAHGTGSPSGTPSSLPARSPRSRAGRVSVAVVASLALLVCGAAGVVIWLAARGRDSPATASTYTMDNGVSLRVKFPGEPQPDQLE